MGPYRKIADTGNEAIWINDAADAQVWFASGKWIINHQDLYTKPTTTQVLQSTSAPACPETPGTKWKYWDGGQFIGVSIIDTSVIALSEGETHLIQWYQAYHAQT